MRVILLLVTFFWMLCDLAVIQGVGNDGALWFVVGYGLVILVLLATESHSDRRQSTYYIGRK